MVTAGPLPYLCCQLAWAPCPQCPVHYQEDFLEEVLMLVPSPVSFCRNREAALCACAQRLWGLISFSGISPELGASWKGGRLQRGALASLPLPGLRGMGS